jgi:hypothetical protein
MCALCKNNVEFVSHLFVLCPYVAQVWTLVAQSIKPKSYWTKQSLEYYVYDWLHDA